MSTIYNCTRAYKYNTSQPSLESSQHLITIQKLPSTNPTNTYNPSSPIPQTTKPPTPFHPPRLSSVKMYSWLRQAADDTRRCNAQPFGSNPGQLTSTQAQQLTDTGFQGLTALDQRHEEMRRQTVDRDPMMTGLSSLFDGLNINK